MKRCKFSFILIFIAANACGQVIKAQIDTLTSGKNNRKAEDLFSVGIGVQHGFIFPYSFFRIRKLYKTSKAHVPPAWKLS